MSKEMNQLLLEEIRLNRKAISELTTQVNTLDKDVMSNKIKLSFFIGGISLLFNIAWAIISTKIKTIS
jgi:hypothetical protein